jgi:hypothetical protein
MQRALTAYLYVWLAPGDRGCFCVGLGVGGKKKGQRFGESAARAAGKRRARTENNKTKTRSNSHHRAIRERAEVVERGLGRVLVLVLAGEAPRRDRVVAAGANKLQLNGRRRGVKGARRKGAVRAAGRRHARRDGRLAVGRELKVGEGELLGELRLRDKVAAVLQRRARLGAGAGEKVAVGREGRALFVAAVLLAGGGAAVVVGGGSSAAGGRREERGAEEERAHAPVKGGHVCCCLAAAFWQRRREKKKRGFFGVPRASNALRAC